MSNDARAGELDRFAKWLYAKAERPLDAEDHRDLDSYVDGGVDVKEIVLAWAKASLMAAGLEADRRSAALRAIIEKAAAPVAPADGEAASGTTREPSLVTEPRPIACEATAAMLRGALDSAGNALEDSANWLDNAGRPGFGEHARAAGERARVAALSSGPAGVSEYELRRAALEAMRLLDNPPGIRHKELAALNVRAWKVLRQALSDPAPERFTCPDCGPGVATDEDGCCATCGADCRIEPAGALEAAKAAAGKILQLEQGRDAARESLESVLAALEDMVEECAYGDNCPPFGTRHGRCHNCELVSIHALACEALLGVKS